MFGAVPSHYLFVGDTRTPGQVSHTPVGAKPSPQLNSAQKRMTDFLQPAKKKLKVDDLSVSPRSIESASPQPRKVTLINLTDSPETPERKPKLSKPSGITPNNVPTSNLSNKVIDSNTPSSKAAQSPAPRRVGISTLQSGAGPQSVSGPAVQKASSPRRVAFTTLKSPLKSPRSETEFKTPPKAEVKPTISPQSAKSPRRVAFTTLSSPSTQVTTQDVSPQAKKSPRRVALTTISTPPKPNSPQTDTKPQSVKSPRRVQLTTLQPVMSTATGKITATKPTLTERSQNAQKIQANDKPIKTGAL